jgi:thiamine transport system substrate-binding protein
MKKVFLLILVLFLLAACGSQEPVVEEVESESETAVAEESVAELTGETAEENEPESALPIELTLMSHDSFAISEDVLVAFEEENNAKITLLPSGDTGAALNQAILAKDNPLADVFFGVDNTFLGRALAAEIFEAYDSPVLAEIDDALKLDPSNSLLPIDYGDVCINYDKSWFAENELEIPASLGALTDPMYESLLVVENPGTSSPGLAFLLATIGQFGADGDYTYLDFWADLRANDVLVTNGWEDAYYGHFSVASDGERPLVVSYASSPPAEFIYADPPVEESPSASLVASGMCFRQIEFVSILRGTEKRELAEDFIDYMLSETFQEDIPLNMFVFPANQNAEIPQEFTDWAQIPTEFASVDPADIDAHRDEWIEAWTEVVLR